MKQVGCFHDKVVVAVKKWIRTGWLVMTCAGCIELDAAPRVEVPDEWRHVWVLEQEYFDDGPVPECFTDSPTEIYFNTPNAGTCMPCGCSFSGATCSGPGFGCVTDLITTDCDGIEKYKPMTASCQVQPSVQTGRPAYCVLTSGPAVTAPGLCDGGVSSVVGPKWGRQFFACGYGGTDCTNTACLGFPEGAFANAASCVTRPGELDCPAEWPNKRVAYEKGEDLRTCSNCSCDTSSIVCSGGSIQIFDDGTCSNGLGSTTLESMAECKLIEGYVDSGGWSFVALPGTPSSEGTCIQPTLSGKVEPVGARTVCCR